MPIPNKLQKLGPSPKGDCKVHKYIRFSKKNKTYRSDVYYCTKCPNYVMANMIVGHKCECWKCNRVFTIGIKPPKMKPTCGCENQITAIIGGTNESTDLDWLDEGEGIDSLMEMIDKKIG